MLRILVIDDDPNRRYRISKELSENFPGVGIDNASSVHKAKAYLSENYYFTIFLDMALPYRDGDLVDSKAGLKLLEKISLGKFNSTPNRVIGFTALIEEFKEKESNFNKLGFMLYETSGNNFNWLLEAINQVAYCLRSIESYKSFPTDLAILSIHGIETNGSWQSNLYTSIKEEFKDVKISNLQYKYEKYPVIRFIFPSLRKKMIIHFSEQFENWLLENKTKRIHLFSHSFGTYILVKSLEMLSHRTDLTNLELVLLSGSVLDQNYDFSFLKKAPNAKFVNDCARQDGALLFSKAFVMGTGMGGRTGFRGLMNSKFINRSYPGGHSVFFENDCQIVREHWVPLVKSNYQAEPFDKSAEHLMDKPLEYMSRVSSKIKFLYYLMPIVIIVYFVCLNL
ncbi:hypothetical protein [Rheinheimera gaetbuli]